LLGPSGPDAPYDLQIERLESLAVVEVAKVGEFVTEGVYQARVLERLPRHGVTQADLDLAVFAAAAVATLHVGAFRADGFVLEAELSGDPLGIPVEPLDQIANRASIHALHPIIPGRSAPSRPGEGREECRIRAPCTEWLDRLNFRQIRRKKTKEFEFKRSRNW
jgi:hypothetical protein